MEAHDHRKPNLPGHEGHSGGIHVCQKCGWPFPNPHPNAKNRRAHKKVCGTIEGYRLDNGEQEKTHLMDGFNGKHVSDDEHKTPSGKVVERTISRKSSSGVGSRSSRSNRSEDEVFADAATDFTDISASGEASDGGLQRFYSMQIATEDDINDTKHFTENYGVDNLYAPKILPKDHQDQVQTVQNLESENDRVEAGILSKDETSSSTSGPAMFSASVTVQSENKVEHYIEQPSKISCTVADENKEILSSQEASGDVCVLRASNEKIRAPASADEIVKLRGMDTTGSVNNIQCTQVVDVPGNFHFLAHPTEVIGPASKSSEVMKDHGLTIGANEDVNVQAVQAVPDPLPLHKHPEMVVEDLTGSATETESVEGGISHAAEVCSCIDLTEAGDSKKICSEDDVLTSVDAMENKFKQDVAQKSVVEQSTVGEPGQIHDAEASDAGICELRIKVVTDFKIEGSEDKQVTGAEEPKPVPSFDNIFPEGASADNLEFTSNADADTSNSVKSNMELDQVVDSGDVMAASSQPMVESSVDSSAEAECIRQDGPGAILKTDSLPGSISRTIPLVVQETDEGEASRKELSGSSLLAERAINDILPQVEELHNSNDTGNEGNIGVVRTLLDTNEMKSGGKDNEVVNAETELGCGLGTAGSSNGIHESLQPERVYDHCNSDKVVDSGDVMTASSQPMVESTGDSSAEAECISQDGPGASLKTDSLPGSNSRTIPSDTLELCEDAQCSLLSVAAFSDTTCAKRSGEEAFGVAEGDRIFKQQVSTVDVIPDSNSQTDSLEGNWGSVSVMSAVSDTPPAGDTPGSDHCQESTAEGKVSLERKPAIESRHSESKTSVEPHAESRNMEGVSEIQTLEEQQQKGSALQTAWSSLVGHVEKAPIGGKKNEEIIAKVTNWSTEKNHTPLKTLLGEATVRSRAESPIYHNQSSNPLPQTDEIPVTANNGVSKTENVILSSNNPTVEEMGKEWNSPARYPVNIKTEKRRAKGRSYWVPFLCCSSVNAR